MRIMGHAPLLTPLCRPPCSHLPSPASQTAERAGRGRPPFVRRKSYCLSSAEPPRLLNAPTSPLLPPPLRPTPQSPSRSAPPWSRRDLGSPPATRTWPPWCKVHACARSRAWCATCAAAREALRGPSQCAHPELSDSSGALRARQALRALPMSVRDPAPAPVTCCGADAGHVLRCRRAYWLQ